MSNEQNQTSMYDLADKFIALANEAGKKDPTGTVGMGLRYAAARYCAFEASIAMNDLAAEKERLMEMFMNDYRAMLSENLDAYIQHTAAQKKQG